MATEEYVNEINKSIGYDEGHIYWRPGRTWSSVLWQRLSSQGWTMRHSRGGLYEVRDNAGRIVVDGEVGRVNALAALARLMR
jgi:hypothetical protein